MIVTGAGSALTGAFDFAVEPVPGKATDAQIIASWGALPTAPVGVDLGG